MSTKWTFVRVAYHEAQEVKPKAQTDWLGFCKGGALLSTKWTFVRVVFAQKKTAKRTLFSQSP